MTYFVLYNVVGLIFMMVQSADTVMATVLDWLFWPYRLPKMLLKLYQGK